MGTQRPQRLKQMTIRLSRIRSHFIWRTGARFACRTVIICPSSPKAAFFLLWKPKGDVEFINLTMVTSLEGKKLPEEVSE
jgi:hypothetical protein